MLTDFRHALRTLRHAPAFTLVVILTLGLGIGANTAIFSLMDQLLLRLLPVSRPGRTGAARRAGAVQRPDDERQDVLIPDVPGLPRPERRLDGTIARAGFAATHACSRRRPSASTCELVSGNYLRGARRQPGARPRALRRTTTASPGGHPVVVLSYGYWQRRFAGSPQILNQSLTINSDADDRDRRRPAGFAGSWPSTRQTCSSR